MLQTTRRIPDFTQKAEVFGWDNPRIARAIGKALGVEVVDTIRTVADSSGGSGGTTAQQGVEQTLYEQFVRRFPIYDLFEKEESNGLVHAFDQWSGFSGAPGTPPTVTENGAVGDDKNTYAQQTTNIAVFGQRRGASLKSQFGNRQSIGPVKDLSMRELEGGLLTIAHGVSLEMCRFQNTDAAQTTATAVKGQYDANGFNGLRYQYGASVVPSGNTISVDITSGYDPSKQTLLSALGAAGDKIVDAIGVPPDFVICDTGRKRLLLNEQLPLRRHIEGAEVRPGIKLSTVELGWGEVPIYDLPGDSIGTISNTGTFVDIYLGVSNTVSIPWLGGPTPTVLEIPIGADGKLIKYTIPFLMVGMAFHTPAALARVQVKIA